jgi:hypothetical protein
MRGSAANGLAKNSATRIGKYHEPEGHAHRKGHEECIRPVEAAAAADCRYRTAMHHTRMMAAAARGGLSEETSHDLHQEPAQSTCRLPDDKNGEVNVRKHDRTCEKQDATAQLLATHE